MKKSVLYILLIITKIATAQPDYFKPPVKIPMILSASFAELRSNHFHSGIDIKTQGVTGIPVYSAADGYVSRIAVSPTGFGNAIYIDHPNGMTTVCGHLESFREDIAKYVRNLQYKNQSFEIDTILRIRSNPPL